MWKHFWLWKSKEQGRSCPFLVGAGGVGTRNKRGIETDWNPLIFHCVNQTDQGSDVNGPGKSKRSWEAHDDFLEGKKKPPLRRIMSYF